MGITAAFAGAICIGPINSFMIVRLKVPDMLLTLATMFVFQGATMTYTSGATISQNMVMADGSFAQITSFLEIRARFHEC